jgi:tripartite-type tricarboxylate transporter receptor subunit TctC
MEKVLKQPVVLTNKSGAAGAVGMQSVAVAQPDGYTISITVPAISTLPEVDKLFGRAPVITREQFVPIARINADPCLIVPPSARTSRAAAGTSSTATSTSLSERAVPRARDPKSRHTPRPARRREHDETRRAWRRPSMGVR